MTLIKLTTNKIARVIISDLYFHLFNQNLFFHKEFCYFQCESRHPVIIIVILISIKEVYKEGWQILSFLHKLYFDFLQMLAYSHILSQALVVNCNNSLEILLKVWVRHLVYQIYHSKIILHNLIGIAYIRADKLVMIKIILFDLLYQLKKLVAHSFLLFTEFVGSFLVIFGQATLIVIGIQLIFKKTNIFLLIFSRVMDLVQIIILMPFLSISQHFLISHFNWTQVKSVIFKLFCSCFIWIYRFNVPNSGLEIIFAYLAQ